MPGAFIPPRQPPQPPPRASERARRTAITGIWAPDRRDSTLASILAWLLIVILVVPQGFDFRGINGMPTSGDVSTRLILLFIQGSSCLLVFRRLARAKAFVKWVNPFFWAFVGLATASILWSIEPGVTIKRIVRLATIVLACIAFVITAWSEKRFQTQLRTILTWLLLASVIFVFLDPEDSIHTQTNVELNGAWHGITIGKNVLGSLASTAFILWLHGWLSKEVRPFMAVAGMSLATVNLVMCRSSTSIMATAFAVMFMLIILRAPGSLRRYMPYLVGTFAAVILLYCLAVLHLVSGLDIILTPVTALTGKDLTFSGRTAIWEVLNEHIRLRPWFGTGYGAYWIGPTPLSPSFEMLTRLFFYPTEGHNGYLDVINDLGTVGGLCLLGYFGAYVRQALALTRLNRYQGGLYMTMLFRGFIADMSESHWFLVLSVDFIIMTLATMALARSYLQASLERSAGVTVRGQRPTLAQSVGA